MPTISSANPAVRLLIETTAFDSNSVASRGGTCTPAEWAMEWAVAREFEYVDSSGDMDDPKSFGVGRIRDALQAHMWSNIVLKDTPKSTDRANMDDASTMTSNFNQPGSERDDIGNIQDGENREHSATDQIDLGVNAFDINSLLSVRTFSLSRTAWEYVQKQRVVCVPSSH